MDSESNARIELLTARKLFADKIELLNIGGEGEVPDAVNLNNFASPVRPIKEILESGPFIIADMENTGLPPNSVLSIIGKMLPQGSAEWCLRVVTEQLRIMRPGSIIRLTSWSGPGIWANAMDSCGFDRVAIKASFATGYKP